MFKVNNKDTRINVHHDVQGVTMYVLYTINVRRELSKRELCKTSRLLHYVSIIPNHFSLRSGRTTFNENCISLRGSLEPFLFPFRMKQSTINHMTLRISFEIKEIIQNYLFLERNETGCIIFRCGTFQLLSDTVIMLKHYYSYPV